MSTLTWTRVQISLSSNYFASLRKNSFYTKNRLLSQTNDRGWNRVVIFFYNDRIRGRLFQVYAPALPGQVTAWKDYRPTSSILEARAAYSINISMMFDYEGMKYDLWSRIYNTFKL